MSFNTKLVQYRKRSGINQKELALRIGLHYKHYNDIERGVASLPRLDTIVRIIEELNLTTDEARDLLIEKGVPAYLFDDPSK